MDRTRLRSRPALLLLTSALLMSLALGLTYIALHQVKDLRGAPVDAAANPLTDDQSRDQVLQAARQFVSVGRLGAPRASYLLQSCAQDNEPPYQGTVYLNFDVPSITETPAYFRRIAGSLTARGWTEGLPPNHHPGGKVMVKNGVSALFYRDPDTPGRGVLRIYGECRNVTDHRSDSSGFLEVTGRVTTD